MHSSTQTAKQTTRCQRPLVPHPFGAHSCVVLPFSMFLLLAIPGQISFFLYCIPTLGSFGRRPFWWGPLSVCRCKLQQAGSSHCRPYVHVVFIILMFNLRGISGFVTCHTVNVGQLHHIAAVPAVPARRPPGGVRCRHGPACLLFGSSQHKPT